MVAALFVETGGCYYGLPDVDPWDETRDARLYAGPHPVVAHPPCSRWCRLAGLVEARWGHKKGDDGGCFASALRSVRTWGGVLEHPAHSDAFKAFSLPIPQRGGGWTRGLCGGWSCYVEQSRYGHLAKKATWLYTFGLEPLPSLRFGWVPDSEVQPTRWRDSAQREGVRVKRRALALVSWCGNHVASTEDRPRLGKKEASRTPIAFRDELLALARRAQDRGAE
jgi:hypothetical protein